MLVRDDQHCRMSSPDCPGDSPGKGNGSPGIESLDSTVWSVPKGEGAALPDLLLQKFVNNDGTKGLKGNNLGQHLSLITLMALQQVGPNKVILPLTSEPIISVIHPWPLERDDQHCCISWFRGSNGKSPGTKESLFAPVLADWPHVLLSNGPKTGLKGNNLPKQLSSISVMALQQADPIMPKWPLINEPKTSVRHPGMFTRDEKHCVVGPGSPPIPGNGNNPGICGSWASPVGTNTAKHAWMNSNIRGIFGDFAAMILSKVDEPIVWLQVYQRDIGGYLSIIEWKRWEFIVL